MVDANAQRKAPAYSQRVPTYTPWLFLMLLMMLAATGCVTQLPTQAGAETGAAVVLEAYSSDVTTSEAVASESVDTTLAADATANSNITNSDIAADTEAVDTAEIALSVDDLSQRAVALSYNGEVIADERVAIVAEASGMALVVDVEVGDRVKEGDLLVQIESTILEAQRAQALFGLQAAQASLELLLLDPSEEDIEAAEAAVAAAQAGYNRAVRGPDEEDIRIAQSNLQQAEAAVRRAQSAYNEVRWRTDIAALSQSLELQQATLRLEAAQANFEKATKGGTQDVIAGAYAQIASARASLARLLEGPKDAQIRAAQSQVQQAETNLFLAQLRLDKAKVVAPIDGIVTSVETAVGSMVGSGDPVVMLISEDVRITIPVEENRMDDVKVGQAALINVDAHPDHAYAGAVEIVAPELDPATRTVQVTIRPTGDADGLAPGMFAVVDLLEE